MIMAKRKPSKDRHTMTHRVLRCPDPMWDALDELALLLASDVQHEIRTAIRERLERHNLWPRKAPATDDE